MREKALAYLYRKLRKAKQALGHAESKPNVDAKELESLNEQIEILDWLAAVALG